MNLAKGKMWVLKMDLVRAPAISEVVQNHFDDLGICIVNPCPPFCITVNVVGGFNGIHGTVIVRGSLVQFWPKENPFSLNPAGDEPECSLRRNSRVRFSFDGFLKNLKNDAAGFSSGNAELKGGLQESAPAPV